MAKNTGNSNLVASAIKLALEQAIKDNSRPSSRVIAIDATEALVDWWADGPGWVDREVTVESLKLIARAINDAADLISTISKKS